MTIPAGFAQIAYILSSGNVTDGEAITTHGTAVPSSSDLATVVNGWSEAFATNFWNVHGNHEYVHIKTIGRTATQVYEVAGGGIGTNSGEPTQSNTALLVKKLSASIGRRNRGRMYIPGVLDQGTVDGAGNIPPAAVASFQSSVFGWFSEGSLSEAAPVILHADGSAPTPITSLIVESKTGSQRQRMRR